MLTSLLASSVAARRPHRGVVIVGPAAEYAPPSIPFRRRPAGAAAAFSTVVAAAGTDRRRPPRYVRPPPLPPPPEARRPFSPPPRAGGGSRPARTPTDAAAGGDAVPGRPPAPKDGGDGNGNGGSGESPDAPPRLAFGPDLVADPESVSPDRTYVLRFDGGSRGNPGRAGAGMVLYDGEDGAEVWCGSHYLGDRYTNNEAEYRGLITGLRCARSLGVRNIVVQGDSQLILRQLDGRYKVKSRNLIAYYQEARSLISEFASFQTCHIERARNARADELASLAMDNRSSMGFEVKR